MASAREGKFGAYFGEAWSFQARRDEAAWQALGKVGYLYQGRYKTILVPKEAYLLELTRYIVLDPLREGRVEDLED